MSYNIIDECSFVSVNLDELDEETLSKLDKEFDLEDRDILEMRVAEIDELDIDYNAVNWDSSYLDEYLLKDELEYYLDKHPYYLVFASGCRWNGASGYKFCTEINQTVYRDYDVTITIEEQIKNGIRCRESSHDVPMGSSTYILGISDEEYEKLEYAEFGEVEQFVISKFK